jgi:hypothetical protein
MPEATALRLIAAALAIALPAALPAGDNKSSAAYDWPIGTSLMTKSPSDMAGMPPRTSTSSLKLRKPNFNGSGISTVGLDVVLNV